MTTLTFLDRDGELGDISDDTGTLVAAPMLQSLVKAYVHRTGSEKGFIDHYRGWSNGYLVAVDLDDPRVQETGRVDVTKMVTPGGRPGDASSLAKPGNTGGLRRLVNYVRMIAHALMRKGTPKDRAIGMARGILKNWASGQGNVSPKVRAAAAKALAEQEALDKGRSIAKSEASRWSLEDYLEITKALEDS